MAQKTGAGDLFFIALFLMILIMRYARKVMLAFIAQRGRCFARKRGEAGTLRRS